ncbi:integral membrane protein [Pseudomonas tohonis]|uniref:Integral membrane protein n=1 Tax=Pseudomonas tohonis TaxID=2725477 RepID=A0A6J4EA12_9PSED|nr:metal-dependent hydrolase [Pseudomonas tohonis]BCG26086.1 integral membrane protein [Pseudomonas tohonis]GJN51183.1 integral membrane protein [Pseudomonas tohonis]
MDSITQAVLGATVQTAVLGRWQGRKALLYGAALATLPDLDVLIRYQDAVDVMTRHRGFSHSLPVLTLLALVLTLLLRRWRPNPGYSGRRLFLALWLVLITHPLLDAFTSYGTQLLWPFTPPPTAWSSIFIIDPLYTLPLLLAVLAGLAGSPRGKAPRGPLLALALSSLYLAFTVAGKWMAEQRVEAELARQGVRAEALFASPAPFNSLLWRVTVVDGERYHEALVSWFDTAPPALVTLPRGTALAEHLKASPQYARLAWFTDGVLRFDQLGDALVVTDLRLGFTGYHPFRFILATHRGDTWVLPAVTERLPAGRGDLQQLGLIWRRIWNQSASVPLADWGAGLQRVP